VDEKSAIRAFARLSVTIPLNHPNKRFQIANKKGRNGLAQTTALK
jgi:hypothetical protein